MGLKMCCFFPAATVEHCMIEYVFCMRANQGPVLENLDRERRLDGRLHVLFDRGHRTKNGSLLC